MPIGGGSGADEGFREWQLEIDDADEIESGLADDGGIAAPRERGIPFRIEGDGGAHGGEQEVAGLGLVSTLLDQVQGLGLELQLRRPASIHPEWDGFMRVGDLPGAAGFAEAEGEAEPEIDFFAGCLGAGEAVEAVGVGGIAMGGDFQVPEFAADAAFECIIPLAQVLAQRLIRDEGRGEEEAHGIVREWRAVASTSLRRMPSAHASIAPRISSSLAEAALSAPK